MRYLSLLLLCLFSLSLGAQDISYGLKLGTTISNPDERIVESDVRFDPPPNATIAKLHAGVWAAFALGNKWQLQPELIWMQYATADQVQWNEGRRGHTELNYLSIPLSVAYEILPRFSVAAGPQLSYLLANRIRNGDGFLKENPLLADENKWELGANLELQYQVQAFRCGIRAQRDLTPFLTLSYTDANGEPLIDSKTYHQALHLWVSYALR